MPHTTLSALELHQQIQSGKLKATTLTESAYQQISDNDGFSEDGFPRNQENKTGAVKAFLSLTKELAMETAASVDAKVQAGETLPLLAGVPIALKDNINVTNYPTTCASKILKGYVSPYNACVTEKLLQNGLPIIGKTNLDEFAMGSSTENSAYFVTHNPWDTSRVAGGSSGGSAAAVASGMTPLSLGSDTGGSVRQPAALCGLVGVKPTYGLVSRFGLVAFGSSLDQISPFARNVSDAAATLSVIAGPDKRDSTSLQDALIPDYLSTIGKGIQGLRVGVIRQLCSEGLQPEVQEAFEKSLETLKSLGASISTVDIPAMEHALAAYYIIATAEASSNLARFDGVRYGLRVKADNLNQMYAKTRAEGFGPEVKRRIMLGTFALSSGYYDAYYGKAQAARQLLKQELTKIWQSVDILVCPTAPTTAFKIGEKSNDPLAMYLSDIATIPVNLAGIPALSVPCGLDKQGLPIGLQMLAPHLAEERLFQAAFAFEQQTGLANLIPDAFQPAALPA